MKRHIILLAFIFSMCLDTLAQVLINEVMQSNVDCIMDERNEFPDSWVELYNTHTAAITLKEYRIGLTPDPSEAYALPDRSVPVRGFELVYCDKLGEALHAPFRLDSGEGCSVYLFKGTQLVDKVEMLPKQPAPNVAYGRITENSNTWGYQVTPTPKAKNCNEIAKGILPEVRFSVPGFVTDGTDRVNLELQLDGDAPQGTTIRYTQDGTEPTEKSALYTSSIIITNNKVVRAKAFCSGYLSPRSTTHSYIYHPRKVTLPVISIVTEPRFFNSTQMGIYSGATYSDGKKNYEHNWRRPINLEYFVKGDEESVINQLCETRIQGNASRSCQVKSLAVYANKRFGKKKFKYEFFPEQRPGEDDFKSLVFRNAGNDFDYLYMRDAIIQRSVAQNVDLDWQAYQPAIYYLNGKYIGMLNVRERSNEDNVYTNYDGLEDIDMIENGYDLKTGTWDKFNEFKAFYNEHGHTWDEYAERMDLVEYINLMIMNLYFSNVDFPGNNIVQWRPRTEDGKWRFIAKDTDFGLGLYGSSSSYNTIKWIYDNGYDSEHAWANGSDATRLFRRLMEDADFSREFIDRSAIYMGDFLNLSAVWKLWETMYNAIKDEYPSHRKLVNQWWPNYTDELNKAKSWLNSRPNNFYKFLADYYKLGTPQKLKVSVDKPEIVGEDFRLTINGVPLTNASFDGKFFNGRSLTISSEPSSSTSITGWECIRISKSGSVTNTHISGDIYDVFMPECEELRLIAHLSPEASDIAESHTDTDGEALDYYDARGIRLRHVVKGLNIVRLKDGSVKKVIRK